MLRILQAGSVYILPSNKLDMQVETRPLYTRGYYDPLKLLLFSRKYHSLEF